MKTLIVVALTLSAFAAETKPVQLSGGTGAAGSAVILSSRGAALGAPQDNNNQGTVYVYQKSPKGWGPMSQPTLTLTAEDGQPGDEFGYALAAAGSQLIVGAPGRNSGAGSVYVFLLGIQGLTLTQEIDGQLPGFGFGSYLGTTLSDPKWLLVGGPSGYESGRWGYASAFKFSGQWDEVGGIDGADGAVALSYGTESLNGAPFVAVTEQGSVSIFEYDQSYSEGYAPDVMLQGAAMDFGASIAFGQSYLFVGEPSTGTVYVYFAPSHEGHPFWQDAQLVATLTDAALPQGLGTSLSVSGKNLLVGSSGQVDLFLQPLGSWKTTSQPDFSYAVVGNSATWQIGPKPGVFITGDPQNNSGWVTAK